MCDIGKKYLNTETRERLWFTDGSEQVNTKGFQFIIIRALYGLTTFGAEWKKKFADYMWHTLGFEPFFGADDNV